MATALDAANDAVATLALDALQEMDLRYAAWTAQRAELARLYARVVSAHIFPGAILDKRARQPPLCLVHFDVAQGNGRDALQFQIEGEPFVHVAPDGEPALSKWSVKAAPLSRATGKVMSGRTHGMNARDGLVLLSGRVFCDAYSPTDGASNYRQIQREAFIRFVVECEQALEARLSYDESRSQQDLAESGG